MQAVKAKPLSVVDRKTLTVSPVKQYVTEDYNLFNLSAFNRKPVPSKKLLESIKKNDLTKYNPILVDKHMTIVDGQHRFLACMELQIPIHFIVADEVVVNDAAGINQATKNWATTDYIEHFAKLGVAPYQRLIKLAKQYDLHITNLLALGKASVDKTVTIADLVRSGKFEFRFPDARIKELLDNFQIFLKPEYDYDFAHSTVFFKSYIRVATLPDYKHANMVAKLKIASGYIKQQPSLSMMAEGILKTYNYKLQKKLKLDKQSRKVDDEQTDEKPKLKKVA